MVLKSCMDEAINQNLVYGHSHYRFPQVSRPNAAVKNKKRTRFQYISCANLGGHKIVFLIVGITYNGLYGRCSTKPTEKQFLQKTNASY